ncbi:MAG: ABC transporter permease [Planctomycetales bacterium]|nr:ABC transporter permease [Planctomycetales bacterium]
MTTTARRRRYFALRASYGLIALFVIYAAADATNLVYGGSVAAMSYREAANSASSVFIAFAWLQLVAMMLVTPAMAVGIIATERERRTIEYLFVSDLTNAEIVIGKTLARLLLILKLLLVGLPIVLLLRMMGGIPANLVSASFLIAGSTAVLFTAASVCISVWSPRARDAILRIYLLLGAVFVLPLPLASALPSIARSSVWSDLLQAALHYLVEFNPVITLGRCMTSRSMLGAGVDMAQILWFSAAYVLVSALLAAAAALAVRRVHLREASKGEKSDRNWMSRLAPSRRRPALQRWPMVWKEAFAGGARTRLGVAGFLAAACIVATLVGLTGYQWIALGNASWERKSFLGFLVFMRTFAGIGVLLLLTVRAAGLCTYEKERDTWISLLSTPLSGREVMGGKLLGNLYFARWGLALSAALALFGVTIEPAVVIYVAVDLAVLTLLAVFVSGVGLWYSLNSETTLRAIGLATLTSTVVGGGYLLCCCPIAVSSSAGDESMLVGLAPCMPFLLALPCISEFDAPSGREANSVYGAFVLGIAAYGVASAMLVTTLFARFEQIRGGGDGGESPLKDTSPALPAA